MVFYVICEKLIKLMLHVEMDISFFFGPLYYSLYIHAMLISLDLCKYYFEIKKKQDDKR